MTDIEKLIELLDEASFMLKELCGGYNDGTGNEVRADHLIAHGVTVRERGRWVHPKGYGVSNGFLCTECGHEEVSYHPINPRPGGVCIADEQGNFYHPPQKNFCPNCGADMRPMEEANV